MEKKSFDKMVEASTHNRDLLPEFERGQYDHLRTCVRNWEGEISPNSIRDWVECYSWGASWAYALDVRAVIKAAQTEEEVSAFVKRAEIQFTDSLFRMEE